MRNNIDPEFLVTQPIPRKYLVKDNGQQVLNDPMSIVGAVAGPIIGGIFGEEASSNQANAIQDSGAATAAAADRATQAQERMFNTQQDNAMNRYNQVRGDLGSLFGGSSANIFGGINPANSPELQQLLQQLQASGVQLGNTASNLNPLMSQFGSTALQQLQQFNSFNPTTMAQDIYNKLSLLGQPQRQQDRANLESRLLNQGILTSSPGFSQINSMDQANGQQDLARQIQAMITAQQQQQALLANAQGAAGVVNNLAGQQGNLSTQQANIGTTGVNARNAALGPALQAAGIAAGVPVNSAQPIPTGALSVAGAQAQGQANVNAANITNSFWNSLGNSPAFQSGVTSLFSGLGGAMNPLPSGGGSPINTSGMNLGGADGLFAAINGYGGGV